MMADNVRLLHRILLLHTVVRLLLRRTPCAQTKFATGGIEDIYSVFTFSPNAQLFLSMKKWQNHRQDTINDIDITFIK